MTLTAGSNPPAEWFTVEDFRPGIVSQVNFAYGSENNQSAVPLTGAPQNAAACQPEGTFACIALPSGGLAPMPGVAQNYYGPSGLVINNLTNWITGMVTFGRVTGNSDEIVYGLEHVDGSGNRTQYIVALDPQGSLNAAIVTNGPAASTKNTGQTYALTGALTMCNPSDATGVLTGVATLALTTAFINDAAASGATAHLYYYPDPTAPGTTSAPKDYTSSLPAVGTGVLLAHQNRVIILQQNEYLWTNSSANKVLAGEFEHFYYTDPPNTAPGNGSGTSLAQNSVFVQEWPVGVGSYGSISAGELFMIKHSGGAFIVSGDLNTPTITWLGGATPTYGLDATCVSTPTGMVYLSSNHGAWAWNGGNTSQKLSNALNDDFFTVPMVTPNIGPKYRLATWGTWVVCPNNYVYDTETGAWWKLDNQNVPFSWYGASWDGNSLYAMPSMLAGAAASSLAIGWQFSKNTPASLYSWTSYPIPKSVSRIIEIQECSLRATGVGTVTLTFNGIGGVTGPTEVASLTFTTTEQPVLQRAAVALRAHDVTVTITSQATANHPAPVVHAFSVGFVEVQPVNPIGTPPDPPPPGSPPSPPGLPQITGVAPTSGSTLGG